VDASTIVSSTMASVFRRPRSKLWHGYWRDLNGHPHSCSTKQANKKEAQRVVDLWETAAQKKKSAQHIRSVFAEIFRDVYGQAIPIATICGFCTTWLEEKTPESSKATLLAYQTTVNDFLAFLGQRADMDIAAISRTDVIAWRSSLSARLHSTTVNRHVKILRMVFKAAHRDGFILENPVQHVEATKTRDDEAGRRPFSIAEIQAILAVADPEWQSLIKFGFYSGQRLSDLALLTWANIDLGRDEIRFVACKTGKRMIVPICAPLKNHILSLPSTGEGSDAPLHPRSYETIRKQGRAANVSRWFAELLAQAGFRTISDHGSHGIGRSARRKREQLSFHSLRHSATTLLHEAGVPASVAQAMIGHGSAAVHDNYISIGSEAIRRAAETLPAL
jgi:integrase